MKLEERVVALENEVADLKLQLEGQPGKQITQDEIVQMFVGFFERNRCSLRQALSLELADTSQKASD